MPSFSAIRLLLCSLLLVQSVAAIAQDDLPSGISTLRVTSRLVLLDVSVTDKDGHPVSGLTAKDFQVFEDKQLQRIVSFESAADHTLPPNVTAATVFDPAQPRVFGSSPVTILVLDEVNTHFSDLAYGIKCLKDYLNKQPATLTQPTELLVVRDSGFQQLSPYTLDRGRLLAALGKHVPSQAWALEQSKSAGPGVGDRLDRSISVLEQIAQNSAPIRAHKNLIWVGAGFPSVDPDALTPGTDTMLKNMLQHVTDTLLDSRISLYSIDPTSTLPTMDEIINDDQMGVFSIGGSSAGNILAPFDTNLDFDHLGPVTGGRVIRGQNDVDRYINDGVLAGTQSYTLGYRPTNNGDLPGAFRHIRVVCLRPGLTVRTHDGYYTTGSNVAKTRDTIGYDLNNAATADLPLHGLDFTVERDTKPGEFILHVHADALTWTSAPASTSTANVEVLVVALSAKNKILAHTLHSETATANANVDLHSTAQLARFAIDLGPQPKAARLRFVVRDASSGRMGTFDLPTK